MLQMTRVISFLHGISHVVHQISSVPWCCKWHALSHFFMVVPMKFTKTAQYQMLQMTHAISFFHASSSTHGSHLILHNCSHIPLTHTHTSSHTRHTYAHTSHTHLISHTHTHTYTPSYITWSKYPIMLAFSKLEAARVATEMSYYAAKRHPTDVHKLKLRSVILCCKTTLERCPHIEAPKRDHDAKAEKLRSWSVL